MRQQPVISTVTVAGTALAIFLIMVVVMLQDVKVTPLMPESNRSRFLHARFIHIHFIDTDGNSSGGISLPFAKKLYGNLDNTVTTTFYQSHVDPVPAGVHGQPTILSDMRYTDAEYWKVFDFTFLHGSPFTEADCSSESNKAVITESLARKLFDTSDAVGKEFLINYFSRYTVSGVVKDVPTVTSSAYAQIWRPIHDSSNPDDIFGNVQATILANDRSDFPDIRTQVKLRMQNTNSELKVSNREIIDHEAPYPQDVLHLMRWSNVTPAVDAGRYQRWTIFAILIIIPAINLSSMTQSRFRRKVGEIGVRRAFGCTRAGIIGRLISENMVITMLGGIIGLLFSVMFAWLAADTLFANFDMSNTDTGITPWMLLNVNVFLYALGFCLLLNILCSGIPAWRAARINPVEAIGGLHK